MLRGFFRRRVRNTNDVSDLAQEVYVRMLWVSETQTIENPEAYLYTVARNLVKEHALLERRRAAHIDVELASLESQLADIPAFDDDADAERRTERLREVLRQLSPKCQAAVVMQYRDGMSYADIGKTLGVSPHMVKKYLATALAHCRKRMSQLR